MELKSSKTIVFKVKDKYLETVFEPFTEEEDDHNFTFTEDISEAMEFYSLEGNCVAPKYLWMVKEERDARTAQDMRDYFGGDFVEIQITKKWEEIT